MMKSSSCESRVPMAGGKGGCKDLLALSIKRLSHARASQSRARGWAWSAYRRRARGGGIRERWKGTKSQVRSRMRHGSVAWAAAAAAGARCRSSTSLPPRGESWEVEAEDYRAVDGLGCRWVMWGVAKGISNGGRALRVEEEDEPR
ncbi:hypothetical protein CC85DRAFT_159003 [Cutaneotrichosporon oleaginosum]|uniref:Uncharacterized protein n=1 Tax=Cutaneotrichosporon oleaginosum TaxID=879819 RepID=A0A0J0XGY7_9TREE|nr:uncharacterized protein CC85DRAFT_159003 [Cutaneotrichosporon oleaginosum]KLT40323.1 hypothetical protein CC85DRAFT_159003 [Cutaneotrichosporon oleaginosum]TXT07966.1 hypothetical protein COLE_04890 [Cutaneotrichosporon oleaginosum]